MSKIDEDEFIGNYQVSSLLASSHFCELYEVRSVHPPSTLPVILAFWPELEINGEEETRTFQQKVRPGSIHTGVDIIPILDADFDNKRPYIVTLYSREMLDTWRKRASFIDQVLQEAQKLHPDDARALNNAFLDVFMGKTIEAEPTIQTPFLDQSYLAPSSFEQTHSVSTASDIPYAASSRPVTDGPPPAQTRRVKWYQVALLVLLLILLIWGGSVLYTIIPASSATITITPMKQEFSQNYSFGVVTGKPAALEIQGRQISVSSQRISKTVPATGKGHQNATQAKGTVLVSQIQLDNPSKPGVLATFTLSAANGQQFTSENQPALSQGGTVKVSVHMDQAGSAGNIPPDYVDEPIILTNMATQVQDGTAYISNPDPFTGGTDARDFTFVQQSDLDHVTQPFVSQVTTATQEKVMKQILPGEHLARDIQCKPAISSNHRVKSEASDVTVQVSLTCQALVYDDQTIHDAGISVYQHDGSAKFGNGYAVVGDMVMGTITILGAYANNVPQLYFNVTGIWSFQYTNAHKQDIERMVAGKSQDAAHLLLNTRKDIQNAAISTAGIPGSALPSSPQSITIVVKKVSGLRAAGLYPSG